MTSQPHDQLGADFVYGRHAVGRSLEADCSRIEKVWIQKDARFPEAVMTLVKQARKTGIAVQYLDKRALDRMTGGANHQGLVLRKTLVSKVMLADILERAARMDRSVMIALDGIQDPGNIGAIFRTAAAASVDAVIVPLHGSAPLGATAMKTSAGALTSVPAVRVSNLRYALQMLKKNGFTIIGISEKATDSIVDMDIPPKTLLLAGSEDKGIRPINQAECDELRAIPMTGPAGSLNVSVAVAIVLYEIARRSRKKNLDI